MRRPRVRAERGLPAWLGWRAPKRSGRAVHDSSPYRKVLGRNGLPVNPAASSHRSAQLDKNIWRTYISGVAVPNSLLSREDFLVLREFRACAGYVSRAGGIPGSSIAALAAFPKPEPRNFNSLV